MPSKVRARTGVVLERAGKTHLLPVGLHNRQAQGGGPVHRLVSLGHHAGTQREPLHDVLGAVKHLVKALQGHLHHPAPCILAYVFYTSCRLFTYARLCF